MGMQPQVLQYVLKKDPWSSCSEFTNMLVKRQVPAFPSWHSRNNPTRNDEVAGLIPGLAQWIMDLALP